MINYCEHVTDKTAREVPSEDLERFVSNKVYKELYEVINVKGEIKPYFDIDRKYKKEENIESPLESAKAYILKCFPDADMVISDGSREGKWSYHIILNNYRTTIDELIKWKNNNKDDITSCYLDPAVYRKGRSLFRIVGTSKVVGKECSGYLKPLTDHTIQEHFISNPTIDAAEWKAPEKEKPTRKTKLAQLNNIEERETHKRLYEGLDCEALLKKLKPNNDLHYEDWFKFGVGCYADLGKERGRELFLAWSEKSNKFNEAETNKHFDNIVKLKYARCHLNRWRLIPTKDLLDKEPDILLVTSDEYVEFISKFGLWKDDAEFSIETLRKHWKIDSIFFAKSEHKYDTTAFMNSYSFRYINTFFFWCSEQGCAFKEVNGITRPYELFKAYPENKYLFGQWQKHHQKRHFESFNFDPKVIGHYNGYYNHYQGNPWAKTAPETVDETLIKPFLDHIKNIFGEHSHYILSYFSQIIQRPWEKTKIGVTLKGDPGCGKSIICEIFERCLGESYSYKMNGEEELDGQFNAQMFEGKLFIWADEISANCRRIANKLKNLVTTDSIVINEKFMRTYRAKYYGNLFFTTNNHIVMKLDQTDRRWFMHETHFPKQNRSYYTPLNRMKEDPIVLSNLYLYLKTYEACDIYDVPDSEYKQEQKLASRYAFEVMFEQEPEKFEGQSFACNALVSMAQEYKRVHKYGPLFTPKLAMNYFAKKFPDYFKRSKLDGKQRRHYEFPKNFSEIMDSEMN